MSKKRPRETVEEKIKALRHELLFYGFAAVKQIAQWKKLRGGVMECPLCQQTVRFSIAPTNGHLRAACETKNCINMVE